MNDADLRALVRDAVARHLGGSAAAAPHAPMAALPYRPMAPLHEGHHPSHALYLTVINSGDSCLIEPHVECTHCGYCKSHGY